MCDFGKMIWCWDGEGRMNEQIMCSWTAMQCNAHCARNPQSFATHVKRDYIDLCWHYNISHFWLYGGLGNNDLRLTFAHFLVLIIILGSWNLIWWMPHFIKVWYFSLVFLIYQLFKLIRCLYFTWELMEMVPSRGRDQSTIFSCHNLHKLNGNINSGQNKAVQETDNKLEIGLQSENGPLIIFLNT